MRIFLLLSFLTLSACGFSPVYGTHGDKNTTQKNAFNNVDIAIIPNREGQFLRNALIDRLYTQGIPSDTRYVLRVSPIKESVYNLDITIDSEATRRQLKLTSQMELHDQETKETVLKRGLLSVASHNVLESEFSTIVTEQNARDNALNDLARQIERELVLYFTK